VWLKLFSRSYVPLAPLSWQRRCTPLSWFESGWIAQRQLFILKSTWQRARNATYMPHISRAATTPLLLTDQNLGLLVSAVCSCREWTCLLLVTHGAWHSVPVLNMKLSCRWERTPWCFYAAQIVAQLCSAQRKAAIRNIINPIQYFKSLNHIVFLCFLTTLVLDFF